jgi:pimeloyl-ACP methyl ester carboxylesterase
VTHTINGHFDLGDGTLYYETAGTGTPLVLSHAAFLDSRMFDAQWELLAQRFQVIRYDMRGYGQSSVALGPLCRRDDLRCLLKHLHVEHAHFVGCSNGGQIMLDLALEYPGLALSLTLVDSTPGGFELQGEPPRYLMEMIEAAQHGEIERVNELQIRIWFDGSFREPDEVDRGLREKALIMNHIPVEHQTFLVADMQPMCPLTPPAITRLSLVKIPTLIVAGTFDHPEILRAADLMALGIPNSRKVFIESAGHVPSFERPEVFSPLLLDFLQNPQRIARA